MSVFAMFFVVITVAVFHIRKINGEKDFDIENVLGQLQKGGLSPRRIPLDELLQRKENTDNDYQELVQNIARGPQVQIEFPYKEKDDFINAKNHRNKHERHRHWPWRQYIYVKPAWLKSVYAPREQNYPLNEIKHKDDSNVLGEYSKLYLVLDPNADMTKSDVRDLSNMVKSVFTKPNASRKTSLKDHIQNKGRYQGFLVKDNRRRMRDSKETYAEKDSIERDYKPKRSRGDYGGAGGRTAIPYIRHRGDIFERE